MNYYAFTSFLLGTIALICGVIVLLQNPKSKTNILFLIYCLSATIWSYFYCAWQMTSHYDKALFFLRAGLLSAIWIPLLNYHFYLRLFSINKRWHNIFLKYCYLLGILFSFSDLTPLFIASAEPKLHFQYWPNPGPVFHFYSLFFIALVLVTFRVLINQYKKSQKKDKKIISWILVANSILYGCGFLNFLLWYDIPIPPVLNIFTSISFGIITCILLNFKIIEVKSIFRKLSLLFLIYGFLLTLTLPSTFLFSKHVLNSGLMAPSYAIALLGGLLGLVLSFGPFIYAYLVRSDFWLKGQLSMGFTHELKSPIGAIRGALDVMKDKMSKSSTSDPMMSDYLMLIDRNTDRLETFVGQLLDISKIQHGEITIERENIDLSALANHAIHMHESVAKQKQLKLHIDIEENVTINADSNKLQQVFSNLISNAIKYSKRGTINISLVQANNQISFTIKDEGEGLPSSDLEKIFDRFYQRNKTSKGSGIGLTIAKAWVEAHGGKIWAESEGEGKGTKISFTFPIS